MTIPLAICITVFCTVTFCLALVIFASWLADRSIKPPPSDHRWHGRSLREFKAIMHKYMPGSEILLDNSGQILIYTDMSISHGTLQKLQL